MSSDEHEELHRQALEFAEIAGAGHLVLAITKTKSWQDAMTVLKADEKIADKVTSRLQDLDFTIEEFDDNTDLVIHQQRSPKVSTMTCSVCHATAMVTGSSAPAKCFMSLGCDGVWIKPPQFTITPKEGEGRKSLE